MAERAVTVVPQMDRALYALWEGLLDDDTDTGKPVRVGGYTHLTFHVFGDFGTAGAITIQGSNDGTNWDELRDQAGNDAVLDTDDRVIRTFESPLYVRPAITAGSGTVDLDVAMVAKGSGV